MSDVLGLQLQLSCFFKRNHLAFSIGSPLVSLCDLAGPGDVLLAGLRRGGNDHMLLQRTDTHIDGESLGIESASHDTGVGADDRRGILLLRLDLHDILIKYYGPCTRRVELDG